MGLFPQIFYVRWKDSTWREATKKVPQYFSIPFHSSRINVFLRGTERFFARGNDRRPLRKNRIYITDNRQGRREWGEEENRVGLHNDTRAYKIQQVIDWTSAYCKSGYVLYSPGYIWWRAIWVSGSHNHRAFSTLGDSIFQLSGRCGYYLGHTFPIFPTSSGRRYHVIF